MEEDVEEEGQRGTVTIRMWGKNNNNIFAYLCIKWNIVKIKLFVILKLKKYYLQTVSRCNRIVN